MVWVSEKNVEQQVKFWALIGPFISLLTLLVSIMRETPFQTPFSLAVVVSIPLCWKWKLRGFAIAMGALWAIYAYHVMDLEPAMQLWSAGIGIAASLSLLATALSYEEVSTLIDSMQIESKSRLDSMLSLDEKLKLVHDRNLLDQEGLKNTIKELEREKVELADCVEASEKTVLVVRQELASTHSKVEELLQELYTARSQYAKAEEGISILQNQLEAAVEEARTARAEEMAKVDQTLSREAEGWEARLCEQERRIESLTASIAEKEQEILLERSKFQEIKESSEEKELLLHKMIEEAKAERGRLDVENAKLQQEVQQLQSAIDALKVEYEALKTVEAPTKKESGALRKAEGRFKQLKQQFDEKSKVLDDTRRALFHMQERLFNLQREVDEHKNVERSEEGDFLAKHIKTMEEERKQMEIEHQKEIEDLHEIIASLSKKK